MRRRTSQLGGRREKKCCALRTPCTDTNSINYLLIKHFMPSFNFTPTTATPLQAMLKSIWSRYVLAICAYALAAMYVHTVVICSAHTLHSREASPRLLTGLNGTPSLRVLYMSLAITRTSGRLVVSITHRACTASTSFHARP